VSSSGISSARDRRFRVSMASGGTRTLSCLTSCEDHFAPPLSAVAERDCFGFVECDSFRDVGLPGFLNDQASGSCVEATDDFGRGSVEAAVLWQRFSHAEQSVVEGGERGTSDIFSEGIALAACRYHCPLSLYLPPFFAFCHVRIESWCHRFAYC